MKKLLVCFALCFALVAMPAMADIIIGNPPDPGSGNCFPWGCNYNAEWQQVYTASAFGNPGTINITNLEFYNTQYDNGGRQLPSGTYTISMFSTHNVDWNTITGDFAANEVGAVGGVVCNNCSIAGPWTFPGTLTINLQTAFSYNPATDGNLLIDVVGNGISIPVNIYFDVHSGTNYFSRVYCSGGVACGNGGIADIGYGLVTGFSTGGGVPEPGTLLLMGTGLLGAFGAVRRRLL